MAVVLSTAAPYEITEKRLKALPEAVQELYDWAFETGRAKLVKESDTNAQ